MGSGSGIRRRAAAAMLMAVGLAVGACGGDSDPGAEPSRREAVSEPDDAGNDEGPSGGDPPAVCDLVSTDDAAAFAGDDAEAKDTSVSGEKRCTYLGQRGMMIVAFGPDSGRVDVAMDMLDATPVAGVGDEAAEATVMVSYVLTAVSGDHYVQFTVPKEADRGAVQEAMREALASLS